MGQVLAFPTPKVSEKFAAAHSINRTSGKADNVVLFGGVFIEYHGKPVARKRALPMKWVSDTNPTPRRGQR